MHSRNTLNNEKLTLLSARMPVKAVKKMLYTVKNAKYKIQINRKKNYEYIYSE